MNLLELIFVPLWPLLWLCLSNCFLTFLLSFALSLSHWSPPCFCLFYSVCLSRHFGLSRRKQASTKFFTSPIIPPTNNETASIWTKQLSGFANQAFESQAFSLKRTIISNTSTASPLSYIWRWEREAEENVGRMKRIELLDKFREADFFFYANHSDYKGKKWEKIPGNSVVLFLHAIHYETALGNSISIHSQMQQILGRMRS